MRPAPPPTGEKFGSEINLGALVEYRAEGGWWEAEVLDDGSAVVDPSVVLCAGSRVRITRGTGDNFDGVEGTVRGYEGGWFRVELDREIVDKRDHTPKREKNFRPKELIHLKEATADGSGGAGFAAPPAEVTAPPPPSPGASNGAPAPMITVRLLTAAAEDEAVYTVAVDELRPGWKWAAGKWAGKWAAPKVKKKAEDEAAGAAEYERVVAAWPLGTRVEVKQADEGMFGSWYAGEVVDHERDAKWGSTEFSGVVVKYDELFEGNDSEPEEGAAPPAAVPHLVNPEPAKFVRPAPADTEEAARDAWAAALKPGAAADLKFDGGWWDVEVMSISGGVEVMSGRSTSSLVFVVRSVHFDAEHTVEVDRLRPPHNWSGTGAAAGCTGAWTLRPPVNSGLANPAGDDKSKKSKKRKAPAPPPAASADAALPSPTASAAAAPSPTAAAAASAPPAPHPQVAAAGPAKAVPKELRMEHADAAFQVGAGGGKRQRKPSEKVRTDDFVPEPPAPKPKPPPKPPPKPKPEKAAAPPNAAMALWAKGARTFEDAAAPSGAPNGAPPARPPPPVRKPPPPIRKPPPAAAAPPPATAVEAEADDGDDDEGFVAPWSTDELQGFAPDAAPAAAEVDDVD